MGQEDAEKSAKVDWPKECLAALNRLKGAVAQGVLGYSNYRCPFYVHCDASAQAVC